MSVTLAELIRREPDLETLRLWLEKVPYANYLGIRAELEDKELQFVLPADPKLIGNPILPALHGGVVGAFMELAGACYLVARMANPVLPKVINFSLDYLRPARLRDTRAQCTVIRQGQQVANVSIAAWQERSDEPIAIARAHFLIQGAD
jgi:uncharacterized protein (TIGR00369 family)